VGEWGCAVSGGSISCISRIAGMLTIVISSEIVARKYVFLC
jgi:hypothetical protein